MGVRLGQFADDFNRWWEKTRPVLKGRDHADDALVAAIDVNSLYIQQEDNSRWYLTPAVIDFIYKTDFPRDMLAGTRLPFDHMLIEYNATVRPIPDSIKPPTWFEAPQRIVIVSDISDAKTIKQAQKYHVQIPDAFFVTEAFRHDKGWDFVPASLLCEYEHLNNIDKWFKRITVDHPDGEYDSYKMRVANSWHPNLDVPCAVPTLHRQGKPLLYDYDHNQVTELAESMHVVLGLLSLLACQNVETETIQPAPLSKKERKRAASKQPKRRPYRVIKLSEEHHTGPQEGRTGTRGSPCTHYRRGHIRRVHTALGTERRWIPPTIVKPKAGTPDNLPTVVT